MLIVKWLYVKDNHKQMSLIEQPYKLLTNANVQAIKKAPTRIGAFEYVKKLIIG